MFDSLGPCAALAWIVGIRRVVDEERVVQAPAACAPAVLYTKSSPAVPATDGNQPVALIKIGLFPITTLKLPALNICSPESGALMYGPLSSAAQTAVFCHDERIATCPGPEA